MILRIRGGIVHGDDDIRLDQADHLGGFGGIQASPATDRDQRHIDRAQRLDLGLGGDLLQVAQVRDRDAVIIEHIQGVARAVILFLLRPAPSVCTPVMKTPPISNSPGPSMVCVLPLTAEVML